MKKNFGLALLALLSVGMVACGGNTNNPSSEVETEKHNLEIKVGGSAIVQSTVTFVASFDGSPVSDQASVVYTAANAAAMDITGNKAVLNLAGEQTVKAAYKYDGEKEVSAEFKFVVKAGNMTVKEAIESGKDASVTVDGVVSAFVGGVNGTNYSANGFYLNDETGSIYVYGYKVANDVERGDKVTIKGTVTEYNGALQIAYPELVKKAETNVAIPNPDAFVITGKTVSDIKNSTENIAGKVFKVNCKISTFGDTWMNYQIVDPSNGTYVNIYSSASDLKCPENKWLDSYVEAKTPVDVAFYVNSKSKKGAWRGNIVYVYPQA
ncbi:MAG: hypothetical protein MR335_07810 [Bacilli bacterium]|nr:hypothetical protein [Bacilli bacterium]